MFISVVTEYDSDTPETKNQFDQKPINFLFDRG